MADLSKIKLNGTTYNFKDKIVRDFLNSQYGIGGMTLIDFWDETNQVYTNDFLGCIYLEKIDNNDSIRFYSMNPEGSAFQSLDGQIIGYDPENSVWMYSSADQSVIAAAGETGFPEIQYGYKLSNNSITIRRWTEA